MNYKKIYLNLLLAGTGLAMLTFQGCKSDSNNDPIITIIGANPQTVVLQGAYSELGATADDDEDGSLTSSIIIDATDVDVNTAGAYTVTYSVTDNDGASAEELRTVNVENEAASLAHSYNVIDTCGGTQVFNYGQTVTASSTQNKRILFNKFADYSGNTGIYATVTGNNIDLPLQTAAGIGTAAETHKFSGTGVVTPTGFVLTYTDENVTQGASATCIAHYIE